MNFVTSAPGANVCVVCDGCDGDDGETKLGKTPAAVLL
jgi:hypothetical protein